MTTQEIANQLVTLCRKRDFEKAQTDLFADDAVSIEPQVTPAFEKEIKGLPAILEKGRKFNSMVEKMNGVTLSDAIVAGNSFAVTMHLDAVMKERGPIDMTELCVYKVKDGKIISEEFIM